MGLMKEIYTGATNICETCQAKFCEGCRISLQVRNKRVILKGMTREILEVENENYKRKG